MDSLPTIQDNSLQEMRNLEQLRFYPRRRIGLSEARDNAEPAPRNDRAGPKQARVSDAIAASCEGIRMMPLKRLEGRPPRFVQSCVLAFTIRLDNTDIQILFTAINTDQKDDL